MQSIIAFGALVALAVVSTILRLEVVDPQAEERRLHPIPDIVVASPGPAVLASVSMEHGLGLADLAWLGVVQDIFEATQSPESPLWERMISNCQKAVDFDPRYEAVYDNCAVLLAVYGARVDEADRFLLAGRTALPMEWRFPFMLGYNAFFVRHEAEKASTWMGEAATKPGAPRFVAALAGRLRFIGGDENGAISLLETLIQNMDDGMARDDATERLKMLKSEPRLRRFDEACRQYLLARGVAPQTGQQLLDAGLVAEPAVDELGLAIEFEGDDCVARTSTIRKRAAEVQLPQRAQ